MRLIDADEAIEALMINKQINDAKNQILAADEDSIIEWLKKRPSAQPQRWIPVTERLPEVRQWVLCQCRAGIMDVLRLTDDGCWYREFDMIYMSGFVLAWMPLPEPYKS